jgi:ornithine cyclodeaminase/alanine dehydrogenase
VAGKSPPLRYLSASEVNSCLPSIAEQIDLAARALLALHQGRAEMPPKIGIHPRPGALAHAMPAWLRDDDLAGLKWIAAYPENRALGIPAIHGLMVLNDAPTGMPTTIMEAARLTAARTAAVSGVAIRLLAGAAVRRAAVLGAGVEARSHLPVLGELRPGVELAVYDRHPERAQDLAQAASAINGIVRAEAAASAEAAVEGADLVVTVATLTRDQALASQWLSPGSLLVAVDFATYASAQTAREAAIFAVDDRAQFLAYRESGYFDGYPDPTGTLGELLQTTEAGDPLVLDAAGPPALVTHLGVGAADVLFADAVRRRAEERGVGAMLAR